jgi:long-chain acyl-CoA synthetase
MVTQAYEECTYIQQLFVYGDSGKTCLVAVVVPKMEAVASFLGKEQFLDACKADGLRKAILDEMNVVGKAKGLFGFQMVIRVRRLRREPQIQRLL